MWRLPVKIAEPLKQTDYVYNGDTYNGQQVACAPATAIVLGTGQPISVLCQKIEQATTDASGSQGFGATSVGTARHWGWTYDTYGQILTADGPRTDVTDITTYSYYAEDNSDRGRRGKLATITNALGHVTRVDAYNANGQPLMVIDPNGLTTTLNYDARGRLTGKIVGKEATSYQYDGVGQLTRLILPDGATITYSYDAARRLTGIADDLSNRITYLLDPMGNRIKEDAKDPNGQLARTHSRAYDALNRLAQDIGAQNQVTQYAYDPNGNLTGITSSA